MEEYEEYDMNSWYGCEFDEQAGDFACEFQTGPNCDFDYYTQ